MPPGARRPTGSTRATGRTIRTNLPFNVACHARATVVVDDMVVHGRDGKRSFLRAFGKPMFDDGGEITHVAVVFFDVSREVEAQSARALAEAKQSELRARCLSRVLDHARRSFSSLSIRTASSLCARGSGLERSRKVTADFITARSPFIPRIRSSSGRPPRARRRVGPLQRRDQPVDVRHLRDAPRADPRRRG